jgi:hypothetical protein
MGPVNTTPEGWKAKEIVLATWLVNDFGRLCDGPRPGSESCVLTRLPCTHSLTDPLTHSLTRDFSSIASGEKYHARASVLQIETIITECMVIGLGIEKQPIRQILWDWVKCWYGYNTAESLYRKLHPSDQSVHGIPQPFARYGSLSRFRVLRCLVRVICAVCCLLLDSIRSFQATRGTYITS